MLKHHRARLRRLTLGERRPRRDDPPRAAARGRRVRRVRLLHERLRRPRGRGRIGGLQESAREDRRARGRPGRRRPRGSRHPDNRPHRGREACRRRSWPWPRSSTPSTIVVGTVGENPISGAILGSVVLKLVQRCVAAAADRADPRGLSSGRHRPPAARARPPVDALHPHGRLRRGPGRPDHRQGRRLLPLGLERQALPRRARRAVLGQHRLRLRRGDRPGGARADARAAVLHQLVVRASEGDRARRRARIARTR